MKPSLSCHALIGAYKEMVKLVFVERSCGLERSLWKSVCTKEDPKYYLMVKHMQLDVEDGIIAASVHGPYFCFCLSYPNGTSTPLSRARVSSCTDRGITWNC